MANFQKTAWGFHIYTIGESARRSGRYHLEPPVFVIFMGTVPEDYDHIWYMRTGRSEVFSVVNYTVHVH